MASFDNNKQYDSYLLWNYDRYLLLKLSISRELPNYNEVVSEYTHRVNTHNNNILNNAFPDAGFNLFLTKPLESTTTHSCKVDFGVRCAGLMMTHEKSYPSGFYIYPRSSTGSKTGLRLANSVGIIDSGYRGNLMAVFDSKTPETLPAYTSLVQICGPSLIPLWVEIVDELEETERGEGGFGSTGV